MILSVLFAVAAIQDPAAKPAVEAKKPQILALEGAIVHSMIPGEAPRVATVIVEGSGSDPSGSAPRSRPRRSGSISPAST